MGITYTIHSTSFLFAEDFQWIKSLYHSYRCCQFPDNIFSKLAHIHCLISIFHFKYRCEICWFLVAEWKELCRNTAKISVLNQKQYEQNILIPCFVLTTWSIWKIMLSDSNIFQPTFMNYLLVSPTIWKFEYNYLHYLFP